MYECKKVENCVKGVSQEFCVHSACAFPPDAEVPFGIGCCGTMCLGTGMGSADASAEGGSK